MTSEQMPPPQNLEAEQGLLGCILVNNASFDRVSDFLGPEHFAEPVHARIYQTCGDLIQAGRLASPITLKTHFETDATLKDIGGVAYLASLAASATTVINAHEFGLVILDCATQRRLLYVATGIVDRIGERVPGTEADGLIEEAERDLAGLARRSNAGEGFTPFPKALVEAVDTIAAAYERDSGLAGIPTGFIDLDSLMGGLAAGNLVILAARPGAGKTALATNIAGNVASRYKAENKPDGSVRVIDGAIVGFFSLEMSRDELSMRMIAERCGVAANRLSRGKFGEDEFAKVMDAVTELERLPLYIDQTGAMDIVKLRARARRLKRQRGLGLIVVDYLQLIQGSAAGKRGGDGRSQAVSEVTAGLKAMAKELQVPVIALSQLSRQVENRDDKRPQLSDLRESGSIEQDADVVLFIYREEYYLARKEPKPGTKEHLEWQDQMQAATGLAEIIVAKHRHGPTGTVKLRFDGARTKFENLEMRQESFI